MAKIKTIIRKNRIAVGAAVALLLALGIWWYVGSSSAPSFGTVSVTKGNVIESVDEPATVAAEATAAMSFQQGGQIAHVYVKEGSQVGAGTVLADLDAAQLQAAAAQASAALGAAEAQLDQLKAGTRPEQIQIDQSAVASADTTLGIAVQNAYAAADDAVRNQLDAMFTNPNTDNPQFNVVPNGNSQGMITNIQNQRVQLGKTLSSWYNAMSATSSAFDPATLSGAATANLQQVDSYINAIALMVNASTPNASLSASTIAAYKGAVAAARAEVEGSTSGVSGAQSALTAARNQLALAQAGATQQQISTQQAVVAQAQAAAANAQVALSHSQLVAPFAGIVQNLTAHVGQVVSPGAPVMSLVNNSGLKIEAYASEADVAKITAGDAATVTLNAFGTGTAFPATVTTIDAAETQVNGSPAYMVTLHFTGAQPQIKDGMTGNARMIVGEHDGVMELPSRLIIQNNNDHFVLVNEGGRQVQKQVQIGLVGDDGMTEIVSGVGVGDKINSF